MLTHTKIQNKNEQAMDIRGYLLILNAIIVIPTLVIYTIVGENLNIVGETDEEQARNEKGITGWFLVSAVIGVLAMPVMVAIKIWQWKRDKLSRFEWDDVGRYGFAIILGSCLNTCLVIFTACSTVKPVTTERVVYKTDTLYKTNVRADTFRILDSVFINQYISGKPNRYISISFFCPSKPCYKKSVLTNFQ